MPNETNITGKGKKHTANAESIETDDKEFFTLAEIKEKFKNKVSFTTNPNNSDFIGKYAFTSLKNKTAELISVRNLPDYGLLHIKPKTEGSKYGIILQLFVKTCFFDFSRKM